LAPKIGIELKSSYYKQMCLNLEKVGERFAGEASQEKLF